MFTVAEVMTANPYTVRRTDTLGDVVNLMTDKHIRHVPVVDDDGALDGLVTHRDILAATGARLRDLRSASETSRIAVADIMNSRVKSTSPETELRAAARFLESHKYGCLPVVDKGRLVGIITDTDFVGVAINLLEQFEMMDPGGE